MEHNILCQKEEQIAITDFFEEVSKVLKECDDCKEKETIKEILRSMNETVSYIVLGEEAVGKTTLLKVLFQDILDIQGEMQGDICEFRYGEQAYITPSANGYQKRFVPSENLKGISIIDTKGLNRLVKSSLEQVNDLTSRCQAIFVVLDAGRINSPVLWDMIEDFPHKNMIFVLTKCDLLSGEEVSANVEKLKSYMKEADIAAPIFPVSLSDEAKMEETGLCELRSYIRHQVIGENPILARQQKNIEETRALLDQMRASFLLRKKQYQSDVEILHKINSGLDAYVINQEKVIDNLVRDVSQQVNKDIDAYQEEIISKMAPAKIKERFPTQQDFMDYLNMVNENYKKIMTDSVNRKTIEAIKGSLHELEIVYDEAVGYFNKRENILALDDKFYGSLATGRKQMIAETKENALAVSQFYKTLTEASETLFLQIWEARKKYDERQEKVEGVGSIGGAAAGAFVGFKLAGAIFVGTGAAAAIGTGVVIAIGVIVGAVVVRKIAKMIFDPMNDNQMEETKQKCIAQFKAEVEKTRSVMIEQIASQIREIFKKELTTIDLSFSEFRMSVNIDERKIPLLEAQLQGTAKLLEAIGRL